MEFVGFYKNDKTGEISPYPSWRDLFKWSDPKKIKISWRLNPKQEILMTKDEAIQKGINPERKSIMLINGSKIPVRIV
jgi:hypothetical protein